MRFVSGSTARNVVPHWDGKLVSTWFLIVRGKLEPWNLSLYTARCWRVRMGWGDGRWSQPVRYGAKVRPWCSTASQQGEETDHADELEPGPVC